MAWTQLTDLLGTARSLAVGFSIDTTGYVGLGTLSTGAKANDFWAYDSVNKTWSQKANFPGAGRYGAVGFAISTKGYVGLGVDSFTSYNDFYEYNPSPVNAWSRKTDWPLEGVRVAVGFGIGSKGYVGLGLAKSGVPKSDFLIFDPAGSDGSGTWSSMATFTGGVGRYASVSFVIGTKGYVGLGELGTGRTSSFYEYDPSTTTWTAKDNFGGGTRSFATAFATSANKGYVGLGYGDTAPAGYKTDLWSFDPTLGSGSQWVKVYDFIGSARWSAVGFGIGANGYVGTGNTGSIILKDFYKFDPTSMADFSSILSTKWDIANNTVSWDKAFSWNINEYSDFSQQLNCGWEIRPFTYLPEIYLNMAWDVLGYTSLSGFVLTTGWNINDMTSVEFSQQSIWKISNYDPFEATLEGKWKIGTYIDIESVAFNCGWSIEEFESIRDTLDCAWDISEFQDTPDYELTCKWEIDGYQDTDPFAFSSSWDVENYTDLYDVLYSEWEIDGYIETDPFELECSWTIEGLVDFEDSINTGWDIYDIDSATNYMMESLDMGWHITADQISNQMESAWDVRNKAKYSITSSWDIDQNSKPRYKFEAEERYRTFKKEIIRKKQ